MIFTITPLIIGAENEQEKILRSDITYLYLSGLAAPMLLTAFLFRRHD